MLKAFRSPAQEQAFLYALKKSVPWRSPHPPKKIPATSQNGSAIIEFALILPLFFLILFGIVDLGMVFAGYCGAEYAAQMAVRYAVVHGADSSTPATSASLKTLVAPMLWAAQKNSSTVTTTWTPNNGMGNTVTVNISLTYKTGIPFSSLAVVNVGASAQGTVLY